MRSTDFSKTVSVSAEAPAPALGPNTFRALDISRRSAAFERKRLNYLVYGFWTGRTAPPIVAGLQFEMIETTLQSDGATQ
jgi:hypothetical protein